MPVIGHDAVRQQTSGDSIERFCEHGFEGFVILCVVEQTLAADGAIVRMNHMAVRLV